MTFLAEISSKLPNFPTKKLEFIKNTGHLMWEIHQSLQITDDDMAVIVGHLAHNPDDWSYFQPATQHYLEITRKIKEVLGEVKWREPIILEHLEAHWVIIIDGETVLPVIMVNGFGTMGVYRLIEGKACRWLETVLDSAMKIVAERHVQIGVVAGSAEDKHKSPYAGFFPEWTT